MMIMICGRRTYYLGPTLYGLLWHICFSFAWQTVVMVMWLGATLYGPDMGMWVRQGTVWVWFCGYDWVWWCGERAFISRLSSWGRWRCGASSHLSQLMHTFKTHTGKQSFTNGQPKRKTNKHTRRYKEMQIDWQWKTFPLQRDISAV